MKKNLTLLGLILILIGVFCLGFSTYYGYGTRTGPLESVVETWHSSFLENVFLTGWVCLFVGYFLQLVDAYTKVKHR